MQEPTPQFNSSKQTSAILEGDDSNNSNNYQRSSEMSQNISKMNHIVADFHSKTEVMI